MRTLVLAWSLTFAAFQTAAHAGSTCWVLSGDQTCSITCPDGQAAICQSATGSSASICYCRQTLGGPKPADQVAKPVAKAAAPRCVVLSVGQYGSVSGHPILINTCNRCEVGLFQVFSDSLRRYNIPALQAYCLSFVQGQLVGDRPC